MRILCIVYTGGMYIKSTDSRDPRSRPSQSQTDRSNNVVGGAAVRPSPLVNLNSCGSRGTVEEVSRRGPQNVGPRSIHFVVSAMLGRIPPSTSSEEATVAKQQ